MNQYVFRNVAFFAAHRDLKYDDFDKGEGVYLFSLHRKLDDWLIDDTHRACLRSFYEGHERVFHANKMHVMPGYGNYSYHDYEGT